MASDCVNLLDKKCFGSNGSLNVDIRKAFDSMSWDFILEVLRCFEFFVYAWIKSIFESAWISILLNGTPEGYFSCFRGVPQGDPLASLLIVGLRLRLIFCVTDVLLFCKGTILNLTIVAQAFTTYSQLSWQIVNCNKSFIYFSSMIYIPVKML